MGRLSRDPECGGGELQQLQLTTAHPQLAEAVLETAGALAVTLTDAADHPLLEPSPGTLPLWPETAVYALFPADFDPASLQRALRRTLPDGEDLTLQRRTITRRDWIAGWQSQWPAQCFGRGLWICPRGRRVRSPAATVVRLDAGLAFGTGHHPTTASCLRWLATAALAGARVLDYGCGSGILAIAALKRGAAQAVAVDHDPQALRATGDNARRNRVAHRLRILAPSAFARLPRSQRFEVVLANILARPLIELAPLLSARLAPGGRLVLAGLLAQQAVEVRRAYAGCVRWTGAAEHDGWVRLQGRRRG